MLSYFRVEAPERVFLPGSVFCAGNALYRAFGPRQPAWRDADRGRLPAGRWRRMLLVFQPRRLFGRYAETNQPGRFPRTGRPMCQ